MSHGLPQLSDSSSPKTKAIVDNATSKFLHGIEAWLEDHSCFSIAFVFYCLTRTLLCTLQDSTKLCDTLVKKLPVYPEFWEMIGCTGSGLLSLSLVMCIHLEDSIQVKSKEISYGEVQACRQKGPESSIWLQYSLMMTSCSIQKVCS